ncbi:MAG: helix-turn-helix transcriptional regulator [Myxococcales bacterium]|nr:helix-turn-helix transcriptional regulator [Myxococcales bacterium]
MAQSRAPLALILRAHGIRRVDLAAIAGVDLKVIHRLCRGDFNGMKIGTLSRVAYTLGLSSADLVPALVERPAVEIVRQLHRRPGPIMYRWSPKRTLHDREPVGGMS